MKKILLLEKEPEIKKEYLSHLMDWWFELVNNSDNFDNEEIFGLIVRSKVMVDESLLNKYKNMKFVFRIGVWLDNIDCDICKQRWIKLFNTPGANSDSVADLAIWGTIWLMKKIKSIWNIDKDRFGYMGNELWDKNVCMIWFGHVWKKIYQRLVWFWVNKFLILDPFVTQDEVEKFMGCKKYQNIDEIGKQIDILYINLPLNDDTKWYLDKDLLDKLKNDTKMINIARWWLVNTDDLFGFLQKNQNAWAYIDTDTDTDMDDDFEKLNKLDNCVITPHIGAMTMEADRKMHQLDINKILDL